MKKFKFTKKRGRKIVEIVQRDRDDWFYDVNRIEKSTGKIVETSMIIKGEVPRWKADYEKAGFSVTVEDI